VALRQVSAHRLDLVDGERHHGDPPRRPWLANDPEGIVGGLALDRLAPDGLQHPEPLADRRRADAVAVEVVS